MPRNRGPYWTEELTPAGNWPLLFLAAFGASFNLALVLEYFELGFGHFKYLPAVKVGNRYICEVSATGTGSDRNRGNMIRAFGSFQVMPFVSLLSTMFFA